MPLIDMSKISYDRNIKRTYTSISSSSKVQKNNRFESIECIKTTLYRRDSLAEKNGLVLMHVDT